VVAPANGEPVDDGAALADADGAGAVADGEADTEVEGVIVVVIDDDGVGEEAAGPAVQADARAITARSRFTRQIIAAPAHAVIGVVDSRVNAQVVCDNRAA
jgi:hypothetical protein